MTVETSRFRREKETLRAMIDLYCRDLHGTAGTLCRECSALHDYAMARLECCTFGEDKPKCSDCPIHCYKPAMREAVREVMRYSGPRMIVKHPIMAVGHMVDGVLHKPPARKSASVGKQASRAGTSADDALLLALQQGLPVDARPFERVGERVGLSGEEVLARVKAWFESGVARRFGAVFDSRSLGYESTLCAVDIPADALEAAASRIHSHPGITHCYEREGHPNLWFTMTAPAPDIETEIARIQKALGSYPVFNLPALQKFKIEAVFGRTGGEGSSSNPAAGAGRGQLAPLSPREQQVVRCLQQSIPVVEDPFGEVARQADMAPGELLALLERWLKSGVIRRIALVVRHHKMGFSANSMCVWPAGADVIAAAGKAMAASPHVTHCYERPSTSVFPYNLYAMIHARSREEAVAIFEDLGKTAGLAGGRMMWSVREFKKASPVFFCEPLPESGTPPA